MTCKVVEDHLFELGPNGDLHARVPLWLKEHLEKCSSCSQLYHEILQLQDAWQVPSQAASEERVELVMKKIYEIDQPVVSPWQDEIVEASAGTSNNLNRTSERVTATVSDRSEIARLTRDKQFRTSWRTIWHYGIAASLALVLLNTGFFSHLSIGITTADERLNAYVLGGIQYITHIPF